MKKLIAGLLVMTMILGMSFALSACNNKDGESKNEQGLAVVDKGASSEEDNADAEDAENAEKNEDAEEAEADEDSEDLSGADVVISFRPDGEGMLDQALPMEIESVELLKDGSVILVPTGSLKKNELGDSEATSLMPFADSGDVKVKEIYLLSIGNGGYRTIVALMDDGTISAINPRALIEDHIIAVKDRLGGRDSFIGVEQAEDEYAFGIIGKTEEGDEVVLDPVILEDEDEVQPAE